MCLFVYCDDSIDALTVRIRLNLLIVKNEQCETDPRTNLSSRVLLSQTLNLIKLKHCNCNFNFNDS